MKIINQYKFKNKKSFKVFYINNKDRKNNKIPKCDNLLLSFNKTDGFYIRPDEALLLAKLLIDAVYKITGTYEEKLLKGYNGYKEFKL